MTGNKKSGPCGHVQTLCVFCGSRAGVNPKYREIATEVGAMLARSGRRIVYGGGHVGIMGLLADAALAEGGHVIGVIPETLQARELGHGGLTQLHIVETMHQRKAMMAEMSDAFIALPGGLGTYEEILEAATWSLLGIQDKPLGLLNIAGFYDPLIAQLDLAEREGFLLPEERDLVLTDRDPTNLITRLETYCRPGRPKWMDIQDL